MISTIDYGSGNIQASQSIPSYYLVPMTLQKDSAKGGMSHNV